MTGRYLLSLALAGMVVLSSGQGHAAEEWTYPPTALISCPRQIADTKINRFDRAGILYTIDFDRDANGKWVPLPWKRPETTGIYRNEDVRPDLDGTIDPLAIQLGILEGRAPQLVCIYEGTRVTVPIDLPPNTRICHIKGWCQ